MIIVHVVEPFATGIAVFVKSLTEALPDDLHIVIHGERKHVEKAKDVKKTFPKSNVRFIKWHSAQRAIDPLKDLRAFGELYKILARLKKKNLVDAVHLHSSKSGFLGRAACRLAGITNVLYTPNGAAFLGRKNNFSKYVYRQIEKIGNGMGGKVVCCSESEYHEFLKLGIDASYINNGIKLTDSKAIAKKQEGKFRIVTSGRISSQKDPQLFNAIAKYFEEFSSIEFIWIGDGEMKHELTAPNITITGWVDDLAVKELLLHADMYMSTSEYEGLSFSALEALALQKPMLLSACVGNRDMVKKGVNGDVFENSRDAVVKILKYYNNREMLAVMGEYSKDICTNEFNAHNNFQHYKELYTEPFSKNVLKRYKWALK
jgi:glycosyltransferase involved in cell wall biosynthesis